MKLLLTVSLLSILALGSEARAAAFANGNDILQDCLAKDHKRTLCLGYIEGAADAIAETHPAEGPSTCFRQQHVWLHRVVDVVTLWLRNHPERRQDAASGLIAQALSEAFPCQAR